jgi:hypothetical protein
MGRYRVRVSERRVRDWIDEELMPGPIAMGRRREWGTPAQYRHALEICRHIAQGADRYSDIRFRQWLAGRDVPFDLLRKAVASEFERLRKNLLRPLQHDPGPSELGDEKPRRLKAVRRRIGEPSPKILPPGFEYSEQELLRLYDALRFAVADAELREIVRGILVRFGLSQELASATASLIDDTLIGWGDRRDDVERSAHEAIEGASAEEFAQVRAWSSRWRWIMRRVPDVFSTMHPDAGRSLAWMRDSMATIARLPTNPWGFAIFVHCLYWAHRNPEANRAMSEIAQLGSYRP